MEIFSAESFRNIDFLTIAIYTALFLILFASSEFVYRAFKINAEYSRKYVHIFTGIIALTFPIYLKSPLDLIILCSSFAVLLLLSLKFKFLQSINGIDRVSRGSIMYPVVVVICYLFQFYLNAYIYFFIPILILAICDPLAAIIGKNYPYKPYSIRSNSKTLSGSLAFFVSALSISFIGLYMQQTPIKLNILLASTLIAITTSFAEAISIKGYDNFAIPLSAVGVILLLNQF